MLRSRLTQSAGRAVKLLTSSNQSRSRSSLLVVVGTSLAVGFVAGRVSADQTGVRNGQNQVERVLPSGLPRTCCDEDLTDAQRDLPKRLAQIVGQDRVVDGRKTDTQTSEYLTGARLGGGGRALAIVRPTMLRQVVKCLQAIVDADCVVVPQGANTGLTGGSVPRTGTDDKRPVVVISTRDLDTMFPIDNGRRMVCLAGVGLATLSRNLSDWFPDRESHSTLGSTFLNPTTAAGVAFGSGGTQLRKGPAYTDRALYLRVKQNKFGENIVEVVNTLGIKGIEDDDFPYQKGNVIDQLDLYQNDVRNGYSRAMASSSDSPNGRAPASDSSYADHVCTLDDSVSRYNADCKGTDCNRSEGKVMILATVHDTFPRPSRTRHFWMSFSDLDTAMAFRREVCLDNPTDLPISLEYLNRDSFDVIDQSGRVLGNLIRLVGASSPIVAQFWKLKLFIQSLPFEGADLWCDKILHNLNPLFPSVLSSEMMSAAKRMDHHVSMSVGEFGDGSMDRLLQRMRAFTSKHGRDRIAVVECNSSSEAASLTAFRFVAAPSFRTWCVGQGLQGISVDYALPKTGGTPPPIPADAGAMKRMRYAHFGCNVVHEDIAFRPGVDVHKAKLDLKHTVETVCGGRLPAEHGHGVEYVADDATKNRWKKMDPLNVMNPGVGGLSVGPKYDSEAKNEGVDTTDTSKQ